MRELGLELVEVTQAAALACARFLGRGDERACDEAAITAMRRALDSIPFSGTVVIGEGERGEAPLLYFGEKVGASEGPEMEVALDALEGPAVCATGAPNALSALALGHFLPVPAIYMDKIAVGPEAKGAIDLSKGPGDNLSAVAQAKGVRVEDLAVVMLNRPRHEGLMKGIRNCGAKIKLIEDGDLSAAVAVAKEGSGVDLLMGIGGAPQGVMAAAALKCLGGDMQGRLVARNDDEADMARKRGFLDLNKIYTIDEMAKGDIIFVATGITTGDLLEGMALFKGGAYTHSLVALSRSHTIHYIKSRHYFE